MARSRSKTAMTSWYDASHMFVLDEIDRQQTDNIGFGTEKRRQGNKDVLEGKDTFRYGIPPTWSATPSYNNWLMFEQRLLPENDRFSEDAFPGMYRLSGPKHRTGSLLQRILPMGSTERHPHRCCVFGHGAHHSRHSEE